MAIAWEKVFENFGTKVVTKTDKTKAAYVPTAEQRAAIAAAGISPSTQRPAAEFRITLLNSLLKSVGASYYHSVRETDPGRAPEPRMGHAFISSWLEIGDRVTLGNIGSELFAAKESALLTSDDDVVSQIAKRANPKTIIALALKAKGKPAKRTSTREDYVRNLYVVAAALIRSAGKCEMPACGHALFVREDGNPYLEVHHVIPLGEGGDDTLGNVAALCPHCHRELHFGKQRKERRTVLGKYISSKA